MITPTSSRRAPITKKQIKWVEKNLSSFAEEPIAQVIPVSLTREQWVHDHYTWEIV
jgi:hypothetical protein